MSVFKKYDYWSILESLDTMTEYDYNGNVNDSIYYDFYQEQITELCVIAADMYNELDGIKSKLWYEMPEKHIEFCDEDTCTQTAIAWWNTAACMLSDIDMGPLLENENIYAANEEYEKMKRIRALERLTKKQYITLNTLVIGFITRWLELVSAFDVISSCIRELEYHQSAVQNKSGVNLPDAAYL